MLMLIAADNVESNRRLRCFDFTRESLEKPRSGHAVESGIVRAMFASFCSSGENLV